MCRLAQCCCCIPLSVGVYILGGIGIIMVILTIPMGAYTFYQENHNLNGNGTALAVLTLGTYLSLALSLLAVNIHFYRVPFKKNRAQLVPWIVVLVVFSGISIVGLIISSAMPASTKYYKLMADLSATVTFLFIYIFLIMGTYQKKKRLLLPWMAMNITSCVLSVVVAIVSIASPGTFAAFLGPYEKACDQYANQPQTGQSPADLVKLCHDTIRATFLPAIRIAIPFATVFSILFQMYFLGVVRSFYRNNCQNFDFGRYEKMKDDERAEKKRKRINYKLLAAGESKEPLKPLPISDYDSLSEEV